MSNETLDSELVKEETIKFTIFATRWCFDNSMYEFYELDEEIQNQILEEYLTKQK